MHAMKAILSLSRVLSGLRFVPRFVHSPQLTSVAPNLYNYKFGRQIDNVKLLQTQAPEAPTTSIGDNEIEEICPSGSSFCSKVRADSSSSFPAEPNRYHFYTTLVCPFASRVFMVRKLKELEDTISCTILDPVKKPEEGWKFTDKKPRCSLDSVNGCEFLKEIYSLARPDYEGRVSVPVLWDKKKKTIVNNESADILRMFNTEFNEFCPDEVTRNLDFYPEHLHVAIDELNSWIQKDLNIGVYKAGFATSQKNYDDAASKVFAALEKVEEILSTSRYLTGNSITEADIRLFTTLVRFDIAYYGLFKCNKKHLVDYPNTWKYTLDMYGTPGIAYTVDLMHIKNGYWQGFPNIHPTNIVPLGPDVDFSNL